MDEHCCAAVRNTEMPLGLSLTVSGGTAHVREVDSVNAWLLMADRHLYRAKTSRRLQAAQYTGRMYLIPRLVLTLLMLTAQSGTAVSTSPQAQALTHLMQIRPVAD